MTGRGLFAAPPLGPALPLWWLFLAQKMTLEPKRDVEKDCPLPHFIEKLRRNADALECGERLEIQIAGEGVSTPVRARYGLEHDRGPNDEEIEFQIRWSLEKS